MNIQSLLTALEASDGSYDPKLCDALHELLPEPKCVQPPNYLASIDAAVTLVPEWWMTSLTWSADIAECLLCDDRVNPVRHSDITSEAPTPAIALCIAALKARETSK